MVTPATLADTARVLERRYGIPRRSVSGSVLDSLVGTILSQNTTGVNAGRAMADLKTAFPSWDDVLASEPSAVADAIRVAGLAATRAPRIQAILARVRADHGELSLETLRDWESAAVREYLTGLPGVGVKTAACVLLFGLGRADFPVDTHVHRIALRLGWLQPGTTAEAAYRELNARVPEEDRRSLHINLIAHGRQVCRARTPSCDDCCLLDRCPTGQERIAGQDESSGTIT